VRRFLRLFPAYWLSILTGLIAVHWMWGDAPSLGTILLNLTMVQRYFGVDDVLGTFWTLQVELAFYVFCAGLWSLRLLDNTRLLALIALLSGIYWYLILASGLGFTCLAIWLWLVVQPALGIYLYRHNIAREFVALKYGGYGIGLWAFFLFGFVLRIRHPVMSWLGRISYSLYLQHLPITYLAVWLILHSGLEAPLTAGTWAVIVTAVTIGVSALTYRYVEAPGIALSDRLTRAIRKRDPGNR
jgi:peptidoglycan/LPS O-acetylase OafA/YrhL